MKEQVIYYFIVENFGGEYIDCINLLCSGGGFLVGGMLCEVVKNKEEKIEKCIVCMGFEILGRCCFYVFIVSGLVKYKV